MSVLAVIPARFASTRLPGKPLVPLGGKPMIERVWERVRQASLVSGVLVATDDERIRRRRPSVWRSEAVMTRSDHRSGTERVAEVAAAPQRTEIFVNVQGDEPLIEPGGDRSRRWRRLSQTPRSTSRPWPSPSRNPDRHHGSQRREGCARF